ncbi:MAG: hypothetical protein OEW02_03520 [Myxococcales bacterium]|nr:hypothetical protein [Myxococcales bacterium]MDH5567170.1 hypothetical protein [Myxococcales bacterium]
MRGQFDTHDRRSFAGRGAHRRRSAAGLALACGMALAAGCSAGGARDVLVDRCLYVLEYREPSLRQVDVVEMRRSPPGSALTLRFQAVAEATREQVSDHIFCAFESDERWLLERVVIGDRELSSSEMVLVNAELLLLDLSQNPQRLSRSAARGSPRAPLAPFEAAS